LDIAGEADTMDMQVVKLSCETCKVPVQFVVVVVVSVEASMGFENVILIGAFMITPVAPSSGLIERILKAGVVDDKAP